MIIKTQSGQLINFSRVDYIYVVPFKDDMWIKAQFSNGRDVSIAKYGSKESAQIFVDRFYKRVGENASTFTFPSIQ